MSSRSNTSSDVSSSGEDDSSDEFYDAPEASGTLLSMARRYNTDRSQDRIDLTTLPPEALDSSGSEVYLSPELKVTLVKKPEESHSVDSVTSDDSSSCDKNRTLTNVPSDVLDSSYGDVNSTMQSASEKSLTKDKDAEVQEESRRKRMEEMRRRLNMEDEPPQDETSPSDSQTSSVEGVYGATSSTSKVSHPFKVVDHDTVSMQSGVSIGRSGRLTSVTTPTTTLPPPLAPVTSTVSTNPSRTSFTAESSVFDSGAAKVSAFVPEPDLVTSCVTKDPVKVAAPMENFAIKMPVAPPRKKRQPRFSDVTRPGDLNFGSSVVDSGEKFGFFRQASDSSAGSLHSPQPPSPTVSIRSTTRELDKTLESGAQKFWVVKPQDTQESRAKSSGPKVLRRTESLPKEMMSALDPSGTGSLDRYSSHSNSNSNSSTLNTSHGLNTSLKEVPVDTEVSLQTPAPSSRGNTGPINQHLSHLVSSLAAEEEKRERDLHLNPSLRIRTDSGKFLSDQEILDQVTVLNLDTGERIPLSSAEDKLPKCLNPLSLHIMRLTSEYIDSSHAKERDSDDESIDSKKSSAASQEDTEGTGKVVRKKTAQIKRFIGTTVKKTVDKAKSLAHPRTSKEDHDINTNDDLLVGGQDPLVKMRASHSHKGPYDFDHLQQVQDLSGDFSHSGPVWCMKFSNCSKLLASAGQDGVIRIWVLKDHLAYFQDMRSKHTVDKVSPTPSQESIVSQHSHHSAEEMASASENSDPRSPFVPRPLCTYRGHQADVLDLAWSKSYFLLSSSMDRTVRLWHISRRECLCCFQHIDFVTAIAFHPRDDRYFLSGSLDGKLRLWNIPDKKVALWNEVTGPNNLITTANFCQGGKFAVVGTYDGRCIFYHTEQLKYHTQIIVHRRKKVAGRKITGIEPIPGEEKILVTCNDSRIRLYDLRDLGLTCKYKGCVNSSSQIKATISHDGKYIVSGSENQCVYIWKTYHDYSKFSSARRDRNGFWEAIRAHNAMVTCAIFSPDPDIIVKQIEAREKEMDEAEDDGSKPPQATKTQSGFVKSPTLSKSQNASPYTPTGYVLVSADFAGCIKVFLSKVKPKHSSLPASAMA